MKKILLVICCMAALNVLVAQKKVNLAAKNLLPTTNITANKTNMKRCYTAQAMKQIGNEKQATQQFEYWMKQNVISNKKKAKATNNYVLPIIFHVVHTNKTVGMAENVSASLIYQQLAQTNRDFANQSGSKYDIAANAGIQFALATHKPDGTPLAEAGIDRVNSASKGMLPTPYIIGDTLNTVKALTIWDPEKYVNVWITDIDENILGIATFPAQSTLTGLFDMENNFNAGVVIDYISVGGLLSSTDCGATNSYGMGRTLTHELGHFFGLRHIWGDQETPTCLNATDYVDDTPLQLSSNSGRSIHPKTNECGGDEMFENYMDYSDDIVANTFTQGQVARMQVVMQNSPRRKNLATATTPKTLDIPGAATIAFGICQDYISYFERGNTGATNRYSLKYIPLILSTAAKSTTTVNITTETIDSKIASEAKVGVDYEILTPQLTFNANEQGKNIVIKIIDNATIQDRRGFTLSYNIVGSGITAAAQSQKLNVVIDDDDDIFIGENTTNVINETFNNTGIPSGWNAYSSSNFTDKFAVSSLGNAGSTTNAAYVSNNPTASLPPNAYSTTTDGVTILETPLIAPYKYKKINNFSFKYGVQGKSLSSTGGHYGVLAMSNSDDPTFNIQILGTQSGFTGYGPYAADAGKVFFSPVIDCSSFGELPGVWVDFYWQIKGGGTANGQGLNLDDIKLTANPWGIETAANTSYTYNTQATLNHLFTSNDGSHKIIASINNISDNVNNVKATISQSGSGQTNFLGKGQNYQRSKKVVQISANANSAIADVTIYFTKAEADAWGADIVNAKILKVNNSQSLTDTIRKEQAMLITPVVTNNLLTDGYIAFTVNVSDVAGQYMLAQPNAILPINTITLKGLANNTLQWQVIGYANAQQYEVEQSSNGTNFTTIATQLSNGKNNYQYTYALNNNAVNYYRIKQVMTNGEIGYSNVIAVKNVATPKTLLFPNPFNQNFTVQSSSHINEIKVFNSLGTVVYKNNTTANTYLVNTKTWAKGVYYIQYWQNNKCTTVKAVK